MRPRPTNPHVARLLPEEANDLFEMLNRAPEAPPFPRMHNFTGEKLMDTVARMLATSVYQNGVLKKGERSEDVKKK